MQSHLALPGMGRAVSFQRLWSPAALAGLAVIGVFVAASVGAGIATYVVLVLFAIPVIYVIYRHPTAIVYVAVAWLMFEKSIGSQGGSYTTDLSTLGDALLVLSLYWAILRNLMTRRRPIFRIGQIAWGLGAFILLSAASTVANSVPLHVAELGTLDTLRSLIIFLAVINIGISAQDAKTFVYWAVGIMSVCAFIGVLQIYPHSPAWILGGYKFPGPHGLARVDGPFDHPVSLGDYVTLIAPMGIMLLIFGDVRSRWRTWLKLGVAAMLLGILFTFAREAWIALAVAILFTGLTVERRLLRMFLGPVIMLGLLAIPFVSSINTSDNGGQRLQLFRLTWPLIESHPLLGVGPGLYGGHVALVTHTPLYNLYHVSSFFYGTGNQIDQFWTHLLAESGILGLAAFLFMIVACFLAGRRAYHQSSDPREKAVILGLLAAIPVAIVLSFVSSLLEEGPGATLFWCLMGMLMVVATQARTSPAASPDPDTESTVRDSVLVGN